LTVRSDIARRLAERACCLKPNRQCCALAAVQVHPTDLEAFVIDKELRR
jgi:hypothetical protein